VAIVRRTPLFCFITAVVFALAALNEGNLNHWGTTIVLGVVALGTAAAAVWTLR
jgi:ABC-type amino acid transport system permease subunit